LTADAGTPDEVAASLADLRRINRWFGRDHTTRPDGQTIARTTNSASLFCLKLRRDRETFHAQLVILWPDMAFGWT